MFKKIDEDEALIVENGVYKSAAVFEGPEGGLYVQAKGGFVRLKGNGATSHATVKVITLMREGPLFKDAFDRLSVHTGAARKPVMLALNPDGAGEGSALRIEKLPEG